MTFGFRRALLAVALFAAPSASAQTTFAYVPDNSPPLSAGNTIPFGSATYTYMVKIPASYLSTTYPIVDEISLMPGFTGVWNAPNLLIGIGHLPTTQPCPFTFPGPGGTTTGSFLDFTVAYNSAANGAMAWPCTADTWCPFGIAALGGTSFVWNGVNDVGLYLTFSGASGGGVVRRAPNGPNTRTYAVTYQAATSTACDALFAAYVRLTLKTGSGLFANFTQSTNAGHAPLAVQFTNTSFTSDPGGVTSFAWDFDGDAVIDSALPNPSHAYLTPGSYAVSLTVADASHPASTRTVVNAVSVSQYVFDVFTTGGGVGDLVVTPIPTLGAPTTVQGFTFLSFAPATPLGSGPAFGIVPDLNFWFILTAPASVGNPLHYVNTPGFYPDVPLVVPAGGLAVLAGATVDFVQVGLDAAYGLTYISNVDRAAF